MKVYILHAHMSRSGGGDHYETEVVKVVIVAASLQIAKEWAQQRSATTLEWVEHNSHGPTWTASTCPSGLWKLDYSIEEQDLVTVYGPLTD